MPVDRLQVLRPRMPVGRLHILRPARSTFDGRPRLDPWRPGALAPLGLDGRPRSADHRHELDAQRGIKKGAPLGRP